MSASCPEPGPAPSPRSSLAPSPDSAPAPGFQSGPAPNLESPPAPTEPTAPASPPLTIAIIGAGTAGRSFALACSAAGFRVVLEDVMPARLRHAEQEFASLGPKPGRLELVSTVEDAVRDAALAIDFVPDELESKLEIWSLIDRMAPPKTVLLTPSETLSITDLASCTYRGDRCVMVRGALAGSGRVRLLTARVSAPETIDLARVFFEQLSYQVQIEADPDLPMLLKNMNAANL